MLVISAHADTSFSSHKLKKLPGGNCNAGVVKCRERSLDAIAEALCRAVDADWA